MASGYPGPPSIRIDHCTAEAGSTLISSVTTHIGTADPEQVDLDCLRALQCPDPFLIRNQLRATKDVLLRESYQWILHDPDYLRWRDDQDVALLWIRGGSGKGKTMMSIGLVQELSQALSHHPIVTYFFCQNADSDLNTVGAVIKGLIRQLIREVPYVTEELRNRWDQARRQFTTTPPSTSLSTEDLWHIFLAMLDLCRPDEIFVLIDGLDECRDDIAWFLRKLISMGLDHSHVKWLLTSRPMEIAEQILLSRPNQVLLSLEVNIDHVRQSVAAYVSCKIAELSRSWRNCAEDLRLRIEQELISKAGDTFLRVNLMCRELRQVRAEDALITIQRAPAGLQAVYDSAYNDLCTGHHTDVAGCTQLLRVMMLAFRPLNLLEACDLMQLSANDQRLTAWVSRAASFVNIHVQGDDIPYIVFTHQSARDYLAWREQSASSNIPTSIDHTEMAIRCITYLNNNLTVNHIQWPYHGSTREQMLSEGATLRTDLGYLAEYWYIHLLFPPETQARWAFLADRGPLEMFLRRHLLEWPEFCSLTGQLIQAQLNLSFLLLRLRPTDQHNNTSSHYSIVWDATRFLSEHGDAIWRWPLQIYCSALIFSPEYSETRRLNLNRMPRWLRRIPVMEADWQSMKGPRNIPYTFESVSFSPYGRLIASVSHDSTVMLWNTQTGLLRHTLSDSSMPQYYSVPQSPSGYPGVSKLFSTAAFSPDEQLIAFGGRGNVVFVWDTQSGRIHRTLQGHSGRVDVVTFSPDGQSIASADTKGIVKIWERWDGRLRFTSEGGFYFGIDSLNFSPDGQLVASVSRFGKNIRVWDTQTSKLRQKIQDSSLGKITSLAFSPNGQLVAVGGTGSFALANTGLSSVIKVWRVPPPSSIRTVLEVALHQSRERQAMHTIHPRGDPVTKLRFSPTGTQLITNHGTYPVPSTPSTRHYQATNNNELIFKDGWIICGSRPLLPILLVYVVRSFDSFGDMITIGTTDGRLWIFDIVRNLALSSTGF